MLKLRTVSILLEPPRSQQEAEEEDRLNSSLQELECALEAQEDDDDDQNEGLNIVGAHAETSGDECELEGDVD